MKPKLKCVKCGKQRHICKDKYNRASKYCYKCAIKLGIKNMDNNTKQERYNLNLLKIALDKNLEF